MKRSRGLWTGRGECLRADRLDGPVHWNCQSFFKGQLTWISLKTVDPHMTTERSVMAIASSCLAESLVPFEALDTAHPLTLVTCECIAHSETRRRFCKRDTSSKK